MGKTYKPKARIVVEVNGTEGSVYVKGGTVEIDLAVVSLIRQLAKERGVAPGMLLHGYLDTINITSKMGQLYEQNATFKDFIDSIGGGNCGEVNK